MPLTSIRFSVSVPVLSVQITFVEPSVSTALSRLTTAPRPTSSRTPTARASVITGNSPSGTLPTSSPTANTTAADNDKPATTVASGMNARPVSDGDQRDQPRDAADLRLQRALLARYALA